MPSLKEQEVLAKGRVAPLSSSNSKKAVTNISAIVPVYREAQNIRPFLARLVPVLEKLGSYEIIFCYDPSPDDTRSVISAEIARNPNIRLLVASRRFGQASAVLAGLHHCIGQAAVVLDADLQDPPELVADLYAKLGEGYDVVMAKRRRRHKDDPLIHKILAYVGYRVIHGLASVDIPMDTGEFRIMSRRMIDHLSSLSESHGYLRGMVAFIGFKQTFIEFDRQPRAAGKTNYSPYFGSITNGLHGVVGFSTKLLTITLLAGLLIAGLGALVGLYVVVQALTLHVSYPLGIPTLVVLVVFLGGVQLTAIGIIGEYVGRIYTEVMHRPLYIVDEFLNAPRDGGSGT